MATVCLFHWKIATCSSSLHIVYDGVKHGVHYHEKLLPKCVDAAFLKYQRVKMFSILKLLPVAIKTSERLQAVISALTSGKFYRLPPDMENPAFNVFCTMLFSIDVH